MAKPIQYCKVKIIIIIIIKTRAPRISQSRIVKSLTLDFHANNFVSEVTGRKAL